MIYKIMKRIFFVLIILTGSLFLNSCRKENVHCEILTGEITPQRDGSVYITGYIPDQAAKNCETGFCYSTAGIPEKKNNTLLIERAGRNISTTVGPGFNPSATYYFRAWISNDQLTSYGEPVEVSHIIPVAPGDCAPMNTIDVGSWDRIYSFSREMNTYQVSGGTVEINTFLSSGSYMKILFGAVLKEGVYKTVKGTPQHNKTIAIAHKPGPILGPEYTYFDEGSDVIVTDRGNGAFEINACNIPWSGCGATMRVSMRLMVYPR